MQARRKQSELFSVEEKKTSTDLELSTLWNYASKVKEK